MHTLASQKQFLIGVVTRDPTSANAVKLLPLIKQADSAIASPDLDRVQTLVGQIDGALQNAGLSNDFAASQKVLQQQVTSDSAPVPSMSGPEASTTATPTKAGLQLVATEKNAFLLKGDLQDTVLMFNTSASSPHVVRNLRGDIVFNEGRADVCLFGLDADDSALRPLVRSTLSAYDTAKTIVLTGDPCNAERLASYDVVATRRGTFLREDPQAALALIKAIEVDAFEGLVTVTDAQVKAAASADAVAANEIATDVNRGVKEGFGFLMLAGSSPAICVVPHEQVEAHRQLLVGRADKLSRDMNAAPILAPTSADGAFVNAKRGQCGAIYAQAADLKQLSGALKRDGVGFRFSAVWLDPSEVKATADRLKAERDSAERQAADRERRHQDEQHIAGLRAEDEATKLANQQAASRDKYGSSANAAQAKIAQDVKEFTEHPDDSKIAAHLFGDFAASYHNDLANRWELMSQQAELDDYGLSDFKGRKLATPFSRITIGLRNRMLGDYKTECFIFGEIEDDEFSMRREPVVIPCEDDAALVRWKVQHGFQSVWKLKEARTTAEDQVIALALQTQAGIASLASQSSAVVAVPPPRPPELGSSAPLNIANERTTEPDAISRFLGGTPEYTRRAETWIDPGTEQIKSEPSTASLPLSGAGPLPIGISSSSLPNVVASAKTNQADGQLAPMPDITIPVACKAAILVDAPDLPEKIKTYVGSVIWRTQAFSQVQDQPIGTAVQAEISIPEAKAQLLMQIRRNTEAQLPASHTIDLKFTLAGDSPIGTIKQINVPQMRQREMPTGEPLAGIPVSIADNNFLIGLMRGVTEDRNVELLRSRGWFDVPLLLANGKPSKITFEKGASGERIFNEVLDSWKNAQN